jgi:hypothetical protein
VLLLLLDDDAAQVCAIDLQAAAAAPSGGRAPGGGWLALVVSFLVAGDVHPWFTNEIEQSRKLKNRKMGGDGFPRKQLKFFPICCDFF